MSRDFLEQSASGREIARQAVAGQVPSAWRRRRPAYGTDTPTVGEFVLDGGVWLVAVPGPDAWKDSDGWCGDVELARVPEQDVLAAASEFGAAAAYARELPGVQPVSFLRWRAEQMAAQGLARTAEDVLRGIESAKAALARAETWSAPDPECPLCEGRGRLLRETVGRDYDGEVIVGTAPGRACSCSVRWLDLRGAEISPEVQEAALLLGVAYMHKTPAELGGVVTPAISRAFEAWMRKEAE